MFLTLEYSFLNREGSFIGASPEFTIGSGYHCDLQIDTPTLESVHARLFYRFGTWWVEPENKYVSVFIGRKRVKQAVPVEPGIVIRLGPVRATVQYSLHYKDQASFEGAFPWVSQIPEANHVLTSSEHALLNTIRKSSKTEKIQNLLRAVVAILRDLCPNSTGCAALIVLDNELVPIASLPEFQNDAFSFTLAREAALARKTIAWTRNSTSEPNAFSLQDIQAAISCPIVCRSGVVGVISISSTHFVPFFTQREVTLLQAVAGILSSESDRLIGLEKDVVLTGFLSYSRKDTDLCITIANQFRHRLYSIYNDQRLMSSEMWKAELQKRIQDSDFFLLLATEDSLNSEIVKWETDTALRFEKPFVVISTIPIEKLPQRIARFQVSCISSNNPDIDFVIDQVFAKLILGQSKRQN